MKGILLTAIIGALTLTGCGLKVSEEQRARDAAYLQALEAVPSEWETSADSIPTMLTRAAYWITDNRYYWIRSQTETKVEGQPRRLGAGYPLVEAFDVTGDKAVMTVYVKPVSEDEIDRAGRIEKALAYYVRHGYELEIDTDDLHTVER